MEKVSKKVRFSAPCGLAQVGANLGESYIFTFLACPKKLIKKAPKKPSFGRLLGTKITKHSLRRGIEKRIKKNYPKIAKQLSRRDPPTKTKSITN